MYNYKSGEPSDLTFDEGEVIVVTKTEGDWWTGHIGERSGIFPANYVKKTELQVLFEFLFEVFINQYPWNIFKCLGVLYPFSAF